MKNLKYILVVLVLFLTGCKRNAPQDTAAPPSDFIMLQALAEYKLSVSEPSGLAYCSSTNTLYMISDAHPEFYEMSLTGNILRSVPIPSPDLEGIALSKNYDTIFVAEEGNYKIARYLQDGTRAESFTKVTSTYTNHGIEGVTIDNNYNIYIINEKTPCLLVKLTYSGAELWRKEINYTTDISEVLYDEQTDCLWVLSDESKALLKLSKTGELISRWSLPITQAEGLAIGKDKMYIVSDVEAKLYVFAKP